jgi:hypothetical protein
MYLRVPFVLVMRKGRWLILWFICDALFILLYSSLIHKALDDQL